MPTPAAGPVPAVPLLAASTLGAPGVPLEEVLDLLRRHGAAAVELRAGPGGHVSVDDTPRSRADVRALLLRTGVRALAVAGYVGVAGPCPEGVPPGSRQDPVVVDLLRHLDLAGDVGASHLRVMPSAPVAEVPRDEVPPLQEEQAVVDDRAARRLAAAAAPARERGVVVALETHDSHPRGEDVARVLALVDELEPDHGTGAVWDAAHPWRTGEEPARTAALLAPRLGARRGWVQIKDTPSRRDGTPVLCGSGALPLGEVVAAAREQGCADVLSLEWERAWYPHVEPLGEALGAFVTWVSRRAALA